MNIEKKIFIIYTIKKLKIFSIIYFIFQKVISKKPFSKKFKFYPLSIKKLILEGNFDKELEINIKDEKKYEDSSVKINKGIVDFNEYLEKYQDVDEEFVLNFHRFNWLLWELSDNKNTDWSFAEKKLKLWILKNFDKKDEVIWETYGASERISNSILFYLKSNRDEKDEWFEKFIYNSCVYILNNLEYYSENRVSNHTLNNARALYIASKFLKNKGIEKISKVMLNELLNVLIDDDGFLREESTHYQFLITRWILECEWIASYYNDTVNLDLFSIYKEKLLNACYFFVVKKEDKIEIPLFGDISPDYEVSWLINQVYNQSPYLYDKTNISYLENRELKNKPLNSYWLKYSKNDFLLFSKVKSFDIKSYPTHAHNDFSSVVLFLESEQFIVDKGRNTYDTLEFNHTISHNNPTINRFNMMVEPNFPNFYKHYNCSFNMVNNGFTIEHNAYHRIGIKKLTRTILFDDKLVTITDLFGTDSNNDTIEYLFNFHKNVNLIEEKNDGVLLELNNNKVFFFVEDFKIYNSKYFDSYGKESQGLEIKVNTTIKEKIVFKVEVL